MRRREFLKGMLVVPVLASLPVLRPTTQGQSLEDYYQELKDAGEWPFISFRHAGHDETWVREGRVKQALLDAGYRYGVPSYHVEEDGTVMFHLVADVRTDLINGDWEEAARRGK